MVRRLGVLLGAIYLVFGLIELYTHRTESAWVLLFWGGTLLGGGALVLAGVTSPPSHRRRGLVLLTAGALLATNATMWTLLLPILAIVTVALAWGTPPAGGPRAADG